MVFCVLRRAFLGEVVCKVYVVLLLVWVLSRKYLVKCEISSLD
jgi:hypothetical protein